MELPTLGKQCNAAMCGQLDFLPILCKFCELVFCKNHFQPSIHHCSGNYQKEISCEKGKCPTRHPCHFPECRDGELTPIICEGCSANFCLKHRHQVDHNCPAFIAPTNPMADTAIKLQEIAAKYSTKSPSKGQGRKNDKLSAKVQLMKLKQKASGQHSLPAEERVYLLVLLPQGTSHPSHAVFVSHHWTIGRCVDAVAEMAKVSNKNNVTNADKLQFFHASDGNNLGPMDMKLSQLVKDNLLYNGQTIILEYKPINSPNLEEFKTYQA